MQSVQRVGEPLVVQLAPPTQIVKRDGRIVDFDIYRIRRALHAALQAVEPARAGLLEEAERLSLRVVNILAARDTGSPPTVEQVQDLAELVLQAGGHYAAAKHYILYREEHARQRAEREIPDEVRAAFAADETYFPTALQKFQFYDKYSRFNYELGRRETWVETVNRAVDFLHELASPYADLGSETYDRIRRGILEMKAMPSMRLLAMAGPAARRNHAAIYNCTYLPVDSLEAFGEALFLSMSGCGVGFSVERQYVEQFPRIVRQKSEWSPMPYLVEDSAEGWYRALLEGLYAWVQGADVKFDLSQIRPAGTPLRTKGGRASGPEPLEKLLAFCRARILARQGSFLRPIDAHDMMCAVGNAAVSGGVRRTAMLSLFDFDDTDMRSAKSGDFERENSQRWNANNSAVWPAEGLSQAQFIHAFMEMVDSGRGEPGIFIRQNAQELAPTRRDRTQVFGCNPCAEIVLPPWGMCNLTAAVARQDDTYDMLREKVELATIIGTIQSLATDFPLLRPQWKDNCERERLLGVDINGQADARWSLNAEVFDDLRKLVVIPTNVAYASKLGIHQSAACTTVKPSGNSSQLLDASSGLHNRWAPYYIRNVRLSSSSPLAKVLRDAGAPMAPENNDDPVNPRTWVVSFPVKAPEGATTRNDATAIEQCQWWLVNKRHWTEHNPSVTITYKPNEVLDLMGWVWEHQAEIGGMAFLPSFDAQYAQLPYIEIDEAEYERRVAEFPEIDFSKVFRYEQTDLTTAAQELACSSGVCSIDDLPGA